MKAFIFAAGLGTRLRPITDNMPKALVQIGSKPMIYYIVQKLKNASYDELIINLHHFPQQIRSYFKENNNWGLKVYFSDESDLLRDTGGALLYAKTLLTSQSAPIVNINSSAVLANDKKSSLNRDNDYFLIHNTDIFSSVDIKQFVDSTPQDALANLLVSERKTSRYLAFDENNRLVAWYNIDTGQIRSPYKDIDIGKYRLLAFSGIHNVSNKIFDIFSEKSYLECFSIVDFYIDNCKDYPIYAYDSTGAEFIDVGKLNSLDMAEDFVKRYKL